MCTHLVHNPGTVDFHGALADLQLDGNHLVGLAGNHAVHDFGFPRGQAFHPADDFLFFVQGLALFEVLLQGRLDLFQQGFFPVRLLDEVHRAFFHGIYRHRHVAVTGHKDDGQNRMLFVQLLLQLHAVHTRHTDIQHNAAGHFIGVVLQKGVGAFVGLHRLAIGFQQQLQGVADGFVVLHHVHSLLDISHGSLFSCPFYYGPGQWMDGSLCSSRACSCRSCSRIFSSRC